MKRFIIIFSYLAIALIFQACAKTPTMQPLEEVEVEYEPEKERELLPETRGKYAYTNFPSSLKPVVQFSCAVSIRRFENKLEAMLIGKDEKKSLEALFELLSPFAPHSVADQFKVYQRLKKKHKMDKAILLAKDRFDAKEIERVISQNPPLEKYDSKSTTYYWHIRAAGQMKIKKLIPRLLELSQANNLDTFLAAGKSLEEFDSKESDPALIKVVSFWKYDAFWRAAIALTERNPELFLKALEKMKPPKNKMNYYKQFLLVCNRPKTRQLFRYSAPASILKELRKIYPENSRVRKIFE